ncbi:MAG TPA: hypothetical protein VI384_06360 [Candidatus Dormibacteraeota bacterium]
MSHLSEGALRRMFDDPNAVTAPEREHYASCSDCQARYDAASVDAKDAARLLAVPAPTFDADAAYKRITAAPAAAPRFGFRLPILRQSARRPIAVLAFAVVLAVIATASVNVAQIFAPTQVKPVPVSVADLQSLPDLSTYGTFAWSKEPSPQIGISAATAEQVAGFSAPKATLPAGVSNNLTYIVVPQAVATFTFSAAKAEAAATAQGKTLPPMPAGMDGSTLTLTVGPALIEVYGDLPQGGSTGDASQLTVPQLIVAESHAPSVTSSGVSAKDLEDYLLAQPGISPQLVSDIKALGDPTHTLPIPVPVGYATSSDVTVQGVQGVALGDNTGAGAAVIWIKGNVFFVGGSLKQSELVTIANGLT